MTTNKQTAAAAYAANRTEAQDLLQRIAKQLDAHDAEEQRNPSDWSHAGSLGDVNEKLAYLLASLGDRSAVDAKRLSY